MDLMLYTEQRLLAQFDQLPEAYKRDHWIRPWYLSLDIISHFLGEPWLNKHVGPDAPATSIFKYREWTPPTVHVQTYRVIDLAESLFNLQGIKGMDECVDIMKTAVNPEDSLAEIHIAKMLFINDWDFRFVVRSGVRGQDYDFEIQYRGQIICGEAKCKIKSTPMSTKAIESTLQGNRNQLPADKPGVFFVKVPQQWLQEPHFARTINQGAHDFLSHGTGRVISIVFYVEPIEMAGQGILQGHRFREVVNPRRRFLQDADCKLLDRWRPPPGKMNKMPEKWFRVTDFPKGILPW